MKFNVNQQDLQQALNYCQGVIEKRSTLPILSNILLEAQNSKLINYIAVSTDSTKIQNIAKSNKLKIITTEKDYNRLTKIQKKNIQFLKIELKIEKEKEFRNFLLKKL